MSGGTGGGTGDDHGQGHGHAHGHGHHHDTSALSDRLLAWAVGINIALTAAQVGGGLIAGSLALIADAAHNLSDAGALILALVARRIAKRAADGDMTFGYRRAETVAALINLTALVLIGLYIAGEAAFRLADPAPVAGWPVVIVALVAMAVDLGTVALTRPFAKGNLNLRAAFLHNLADALGSLGVAVAGVLILAFGWTIADPIAALVLAGYILWHALGDMRRTIRVLMGAAPEGLDIEAVARTAADVPGVRSLHHVHLWEMHEGAASLEAHVVVETGALAEAEAIKQRLRDRLREAHGITHSTLEIEAAGDDSACVETRLVASH